MQPLGLGLAVRIAAAHQLESPGLGAAGFGTGDHAGATRAKVVRQLKAVPAVEDSLGSRFAAPPFGLPR